MRRVTSRTAFSLQRRMFESKRTLLVRVTFNAGRVRSGGESLLFEFKTTVRIVAITALHGSFENLVVERLGKVGLRFIMTTHAKLRFARFQQLQHRETRLLSVCFGDEHVRTR